MLYRELFKGLCWNRFVRNKSLTPCWMGCQSASSVCAQGSSSGRPYKNPKEMLKPLLLETEKLQGTKYKEINGKRQVSYVGFLSFNSVNNLSNV